MPTNANTFNSRVTSEALEAKFRQVFPAQGGAELVQDLFASGVIQPVVDFSTVAEGSVLAPNLQTAWDISTGNAQEQNSSSTIINNPGFWLVDLTCYMRANTLTNFCEVRLTDGATTVRVWRLATPVLSAGADPAVTESEQFVVFLRAGDSLIAESNNAQQILDVWWRQIADVNGNLVNPLGFTFS